MPDRDDLREGEREAFDSVVDRQTAYGYTEFVKRFLHDDVLRAFPGDRVQPYFSAMLNSPLIAEGMSDLGAVYRTRGEHADGMQHADREWIDMVICDELECLWVLYVHAPDAVASGVRPEAILAVVRGRDEDLTEEEATKARFIRSFVHGTIDAELYAAVEELVGGKRAGVEFTCFCGHLLKTMRLMQAWGVPDITREQLEEFVRAIVDGKVQLPEAPRVPERRPAA
jgi:alkylhydroperoxidase family enzyme